MGEKQGVLTLKLKPPLVGIHGPVSVGLSAFPEAHGLHFLHPAPRSLPSPPPPFSGQDCPLWGTSPWLLPSGFLLSLACGQV